MRGPRLFLPLLVSSLPLWIVPSFPVTVTLQPGQSIQAAVDSAIDGDEIVLEEGDYRGQFSFGGKAITVRSSQPVNLEVVARTVIDETDFDETGPKAVVVFTDGEDSRSLLDGLTIAGAGESSAGVYIETSSPTLRRCIIRDNSCEAAGAGIVCKDASPRVEKCLILRNHSTKLGGGISCEGSSAPEFVDCSICENRSDLGGGAVVCRNSSNPSFLRCLLSLNLALPAGSTGGALYCDGVSSPHLTGCEIMDNLADDGGGFYCSGGSSFVLANCIVARNAASTSTGGAFHCTGATRVSLTNCTVARNSSGAQVGGIYHEEDSEVSVVNSLMWNDGNEFVGGDRLEVSGTSVEGGWSGPLNTSIEPIFDAQDGGDFRLLSYEQSPVDGGDPASTYRDACSPPGLLTMRGDMGAYGGAHNCEWLHYSPPVEPDLYPLKLADPHGETIVVSANQSIQAAIDGAHDGDEILLNPGTHLESINYKGKAITIRSLDPSDYDTVSATIIRGAGGIEAVTFNHGEQRNSVLSGVTFAWTHSTYGGVFMQNSSPTMDRCVIKDNSSTSGGGGITCIRSSPVLLECALAHNTGQKSGGLCVIGSYHPQVVDCSFVENTSTADGGGIGLLGGHGSSIVRCFFEDNFGHHGGGLRSSASMTRLRNCIFYDNKGDFGLSVHCWGDRGTELHNCIVTSKSGVVLDSAPILCEESSPAFVNCTVTGNNSPSSYSGFLVSPHTEPVLKNCIVWNQGTEMGGGGAPHVSYSCFEAGWPGGGNTFKDPLFSGNDESPFTLDLTSPCIDRGNPETSFNDACLPPGLGTIRNDMGAYGGPGNCLREGFGTHWEPTPTPTGTPTRTGTPTPSRTSTVTYTPTPTSTFRHMTLEVHLGQSIQAAIDSAWDGDEIVVYPGEYIEALSIQGKTLFLRSIDPDDPDAASTTIIDASTKGPVFKIGPTALTICTIKGFTLRGGNNANGSGVAIQSANVTLQNCRIMDNIYQHHATSGTHEGGGLHANNSSVKLIDCLIDHNTAAVGGGLCADGNSSIKIDGCTFSHNEASQAGGGLVVEDSTTLHMINCIITDNTSLYRCGGMDLLSSGETTIEKTRILFNADYRIAGGLHIYGSSIKLIDRCEIRGNRSKKGAGGICVAWYCRITGSSIVNNWSDEDSGGFFVGGQLTLESSTIAGNRGASCGGFGSPSTNHAKVTGLGCIIWNPGSELLNVETINLTYCCIEGGWKGKGNTSVDPLFHNADDYRLSAASPLIDTGVVLDATLDLDGFPRPYDVPGIGREGTGDEFDLGAYEYPAGGNPVYTPSLTKTITSTPTVTATPTSTCSFTITQTPTITSTRTSTPTITLSPTITPTFTPRSVPVAYVSSIAEATADGRSWRTAYRTIQGAINSVSGAVDIWIRGDYYQESVTLKDKIALYGGFGGSEDESEFDLRDPVGNQTRVKALYIYDAGGVIADGLAIINEGIPMNDYDSLHCGYGGAYPTQFGYIECRTATLICSNCILEGCYIPPTTYSEWRGWLGCEYHSYGNFGGAARLSSTLASFTNCVFLSNEATGNGGGMLVDGNSAVGVSHCLFSENSPFAVVAYGAASIDIANSILWWNEGLTSGSCVTLSYCNTDDYSDGAGNIRVQPLWVDRKRGDYHLNPGSPCIDMGTGKGVFLDLDGQERPVDIEGVGADATGSEFDMGPYEYQRGGNFTYTPTPSGTVTDTPTITPTPTRTFTKTVTPTATNTRRVPIVYVSHDSPGPENGSSWNTAYHTLQAAILTIDKAKDIWIKEGDYDETVMLKQDVSVYGGFAGVERESEFGLRDPRKHECVISTIRIWDGWNVYLEGITISESAAKGGLAPGSTRHGFLDCRRSNVICRNCVVRDCSIPRLGEPDEYYGGDGAGIYLLNTRATFENCLVYRIKADCTGGGIIAEEGSVGWFNHIVIYDCSPTGIALWNADSSEITNSIIWNNREPYNSYSSHFSYCNIQQLFDGPGNVSADPLFSDAQSGDFHLLPGSPCIDAGHYKGVIDDIEGNPRPIDVTGVGAEGSGEEYDMGAYEYPEEGYPTYTPTMTGTITNTPTITLSPTITPTPTITQSPTITETPTTTETPTITQIPTITRTRAITPTPTPPRGVPIVFVAADSPGQENGQSWNTAFHTLAAALYSIHEPKDVWVKEGFYDEIAMLKPDIAIYGGFAGTESENDFEVRDPRTHECLISMLRLWGVDGVILDGLTISDVSAPLSELALYSRIGFLDCRRSTLICTNCVIRNCSIDFPCGSDGCYGGDGAGVYILKSTASFENCQITGNTPDITGGGVIAENGSDVFFNHCLVWGNTPTGIANWNSGPLEIANSIVWGNQDRFNGDGFSIAYSAIQGGYPGPGNISADPHIVDATQGDFHLRADSPCIDTGTNKGVVVDIEGNPRPIDMPGAGADGTGEEYDMGPYEFVPPTPTETPSPTCTETETSTETQVPTDTFTATGTPTVTPSITETPMPPLTPTETGTSTPTITITITLTATATATQVPTETPSPTPVPTIPGDVTQDDEVDAADVMDILSAWHEDVGSASPEDVNHDGGLDMEDLSVLMINWHSITGS